MYIETKKLILEKMNKGIYPGVVAAFVKNGEVEKLIAGNAQIVPEIQPMAEDLLFDAASLTKVVATTTVVLRLWEARKIAFDEPLHTYLPAFENQTITLRHLLTHTAAIQTWIPNREQLTQQELITAYLKLQSGEGLGRTVEYTDAGTILLGLMLENIYQKDAVSIFQEQVLLPLDMRNSLFLPSSSQKIVPTEQLESGEVLRGITHDPKARVLAEHAGNAGLFIDLEDSLKFVAMYLNKGRTKSGAFFNPQTIETLLTDYTPNKTGQRSLGWALKFDKKDQHPILYHTGYTGTFYLIDIVTQEAFIFLSNRVHPHDHREAYIQNREEIIETFLKEKVCEKKS